MWCFNINLIDSKKSFFKQDLANINGRCKINKCGLKQKREKIFANKVQTSHKKGHVQQNTNWAQKETAKELIGKLKFGNLGV